MGKLLLALLLPSLFFTEGWQQQTSNDKIIKLRSGQIVKDIGHYSAGTEQNNFFLKINGMGGSVELWIPGIDTALSVDINNVAMLEPSLIAYSGDPIYGKPGLFLFDYGKGKIKCIVPPSNFKKEFPDGTDYFEIDRVDPKDKEIFFWHLKDLDNVDFSTDWKSGHEYKIKFDGTGLMKVQQ
ncbi:MAG: hypothetical protein WAO19_13125 [Candidatus Kryptoniota bacterium]